MLNITHESDVTKVLKLDGSQDAHIYLLNNKFSVISHYELPVEQVFLYEVLENNTYNYYSVSYPYQQKSNVITQYIGLTKWNDISEPMDYFNDLELQGNKLI